MASRGHHGVAIINTAPVVQRLVLLQAACKVKGEAGGGFAVVGAHAVVPDDLGLVLSPPLPAAVCVRLTVCGLFHTHACMRAFHRATPTCMYIPSSHHPITLSPYHPNPITTHRLRVRRWLLPSLSLAESSPEPFVDVPVSTLVHHPSDTHVVQGLWFVGL